MAEFVIAPDVFARFPTVCIGVVLVRGIDNQGPAPEILALLRRGEERARAAIGDGRAQDLPAVMAWRQAFAAAGWNPNKFPSSVEAMLRRVAKGNQLPSISPIVDLSNAVSLTYQVPMGSHDLDQLEGDLEVRPARAGDVFIPFGTADEETPDAGEIVYVSGASVRTRRWVWRQSEAGRITAETRRVIFPIDGFVGTTESAVREAVSTLSELAARHLGGEVHAEVLDRAHPRLALDW